MNFLAHLFLSGNDEEIMVGNVLADRMRGSKSEEFSEKIKKGIRLHRIIDEYTDSHPVVIESKQRLRPEFGHYAPVIVDVFYDHFLAANWKEYSDVPINDFAARCYYALKKYRKLFGGGFQIALVYMRFRNLLVSYSTFKGVQFALERMSGRARNASNLVAAVDELKKNYPHYQKEFSLFFPELVKYVKTNPEASFLLSHC
jgi:acyl carrier protein phosphodiesterase